MPLPAVLGLMGRLVAGSAIRAEGAELAAGGLGRAAAGAAGKSLIKKKLLDAVTPDNDEASNDNTRNDPKAVAQASPNYGQVTSIPQFGASAAPIASNDNPPKSAAGSSMFDSAQAISLLTTSVALLRNIVEGIEQQAMAARDAARAMRENQLENANEKTDISTSEAQSGVAGEGIGTGLAALGIGAAGIWSLKYIGDLASKSADQLTEYFSDHLSKFLGSFITDLPQTMMKFMIGAVGGNPTKAIIQGAKDAITGGSGGGKAEPVTGNFTGREKKFLEIIGKEEGAGYDTVFGNGRFGKPDKKLTEMTINEVRAYQKKLEQSTRAAGYGRSDQTGQIVGTSAVGKGQFIQDTLRNTLKSMGIKEDQWDTVKYTPELQNRLILQNARNSGIDPNRPETLGQKRVGQQWESIRTYKMNPSEWAQHVESIKRESPNRPLPGATPGSPIATPMDAARQSIDIMTKAPVKKPVARSSFTGEQPAFGSMFGQLGVNPVEQAEQTVRKTADGNGLLDRVLGAGGFNGARIQAPKLGQLDNVMMSVLRDIVENKRQTTETPASQPAINMPIIAQGGQQQATPAMSLTVPSPGKALSSMSWDMYFDTNRGL